MGRKNSRQALAFQALLEPSDDEDPAAPRGGSSRRAAGHRSSRTERAPGFQLRTNDDTSQPPSTSGAHPTDLRQLHDMFGAVLPLDLIQDVYRSSDSLDAALDTLLALAPPAAHSTTSTKGVRPDQAQPAGQQHQANPETTPHQPSLWDALPPDCKQLILAKLLARDLAMAARTSREFAAHVRTARAAARTVIIPRGVSGAAVAGLVEGYGWATGVDVSRCVKGMEAGPSAEHVVHEVLAAVARGERARASGLPVQRLVLRDSPAVSDSAVVSICTSLRHLTCLDLSNCPGIGDRHLKILAQYQRDDHGDGDDDDVASPGGAGPIAAQNEAIAALQRLALAARPSTNTRVTLESPAQAVARIAGAYNSDALLSSYAAASGAIPLPLGGRGLVDLRLTGTGVTTSSIRDLIRGPTALQGLQVLDVSRCKSIGGEALEPGPKSALRALTATGCRNVHSVTIQLPRSSPLTHISLAECTNLSDITLVVPSLVDLNVSGCRSLSLFNVRAPKLTRLRAAKCASLSFVSFNTVFACPAVTHLNLAGCWGLEAEGVEAIVPSLGNVIDLDLSGCVSLSRLVLGELPELQRLKLDGCSGLHRLLANVPSLTNLTAKACLKLTVSGLHDVTRDDYDKEVVDMRFVGICGVTDSVCTSQEVRLQGAGNVRVLDMENCSQLRDVRLGEGERQEAARPKIKGAVIVQFQGCIKLPQARQEALKATILGL